MHTKSWLPTLRCQMDSLLMVCFSSFIDCLILLYHSYPHYNIHTYTFTKSREYWHFDVKWTHYWWFVSPRAMISLFNSHAILYPCTHAKEVMINDISTSSGLIVNCVSLYIITGAFAGTAVTWYYSYAFCVHLIKTSICAVCITLSMYNIISPEIFLIKINLSLRVHDIVWWLAYDNK